MTLEQTGAQRLLRCERSHQPLADGSYQIAILFERNSDESASGGRPSRINSGMAL
jgi:hypothetical protein